MGYETTIRGISLDTAYQSDRRATTHNCEFRTIGYSCHEAANIFLTTADRARDVQVAQGSSFHIAEGCNILLGESDSVGFGRWRGVECQRMTIAVESSRIAMGGCSNHGQRPAQVDIGSHDGMQACLPAIDQRCKRAPVFCRAQDDTPHIVVRKAVALHRQARCIHRKVEVKGVLLVGPDVASHGGALYGRQIQCG